jgi:hypothetical protein
MPQSFSSLALGTENTFYENSVNKSQKKPFASHILLICLKPRVHLKFNLPKSRLFYF